MFEPLRRLLNVDEFSILSPRSLDECRELLAARLLTPWECAVRSGSMLDDGRPLFYGRAAAEGFQIAQYRGQWEGQNHWPRGEWDGRHPWPRSQGHFQPTPDGTRVDVKVNDLPTRARSVVCLIVALLAVPLLIGLLGWGGSSAGTLGFVAAACIGAKLGLLLYVRDDPFDTRELITSAVQGRLVDGTAEPQTRPAVA